MKLKITIFLTILSFITTLAYAGSGHSHAPRKKISEQKAVELATDLVHQLAKRQKIDPSWSAVKEVTSAEKVKLSGRNIWRISFINPKIEDKNKERIYAFVSPTGYPLGASFTETPN